MKKNLQEKISAISGFSQINKAFRHVYGEPAAAVLATLVYKYTYWENEGKLKSRITKNGNILKSFFISKLDLSIDSGVSISQLEKNDESNPLVVLESLKMIKIDHNKLANKSDEFVILPNNIQLRLKQASVIYDEDFNALKNLSRTDQRKFLKALNGKLSREEVYDKFKVNELNKEIDMEDDLNDFPNSTPNEYIISPNEEISSPDENCFSSSEGISKNIYKRSSTNNLVKNKDTNHDLFKNDEILVDDDAPSVKPKNIGVTIETIKQGIQDYVWGNIKEVDLHEILKKYIPDNKGLNWKMSKDDESYIRMNLHTIDPGSLDAALNYIKTNVERMVSGERKLRFGSILAGISTKVIETGVGYDYSRLPKLTKKEYEESMKNLPEDNDIDILDDL